MKTILPEQEIAVYKSQVSEAERFSGALVIKTDEDYHVAMNEGIKIKGQLDAIVKRKEEITKPLNAALKSTRDFFRPLEELGENALMVIKKRMLRYTTEKEKKVEEAKAKIDARVEKGTLKPGTGEVKKFIADQAISKTIGGSEGSATTRKVKKYYVTNLEDVPLDFIEVNMPKVRASFKAGYAVPGIEERLENELAINLTQ